MVHGIEYCSRASLLLTLSLCLGLAACDVELDDEAELGSEQEELLWGPVFPTITAYAVVPGISGFAPISARPGEQIIVSGANFNRTAKGYFWAMNWGAPWQVYVGNRSVDFAVISSTQLRLTVPSGQSGGRVSIREDGTPITQSSESFLAAPSNLSARAVSSRELRLEWSDNANDETAYEIWSSSPSWHSLGTVAANTRAEPITELSANRSYQYKVRAVRNGQFSVFTNVATGTTPSIQPPRVTFSNNLYSPFVNGQAQIATDPTTGQPLIYGILDSNGDGVVAGEPSSNSSSANSLYPRWRGLACGVESGARFAPNTNLIIIAKLTTWTTRWRPQFVAIHAWVDRNTGVVARATAAGGDLERLADGTEMVMGADGQPSFGISIQSGLASGWLAANLFSTLCNSNITSGSSVQLEFDQIPVYQE